MIYLADAHVLLDQMPAYEKWWDGLDEARRKAFAKLLVDQGAYITYSGHRFNPLREAPDRMFESTDERRRFMKDLLCNPWLDLGYYDRNSLAYAESRALITEQDIYFLAAPLAEKWTRRGCAHREWFGSLADQGRLNEALPAMEKKYPEHKGDRYFAECMLWEKVLIYEALGDRSKAKDTLSKLKVHTKKSGFRMKGYTKSIFSILEKRIGANETDNDPDPSNDEV